MFSGIVEAVGTVREFVRDKESAAMVVETDTNFRNLENGESCIFEKNKVWELKMLLKVCWGSLGLLFGALRSLLGALFALLGPPDGTPNFQNFYVGTLEPTSLPPRSPQQPQTVPQAPSWRGRWPHGASEAHMEMYC